MTTIMRGGSFETIYESLRGQLLEAPVMGTKRWQGVSVEGNPHMVCKEITHVHLDANLLSEDPAFYAKDTGADVPWAEDHFQERVSGYPMNPGTQWMNWPGNIVHRDGAKAFLDERGKFNHNYMERYWPKYAGLVGDPTESALEWRRTFSDQFRDQGSLPVANKGILYEYGQLIDVVDLLADDPYTRQAYLPIWFPEDTGGGSKRAPCTIGYHFLMRDDRLDVNYHIRSCDLYKHFRNDLYLTIRLLLWVLDKARSRSSAWASVRPGKFIMQIGSLHLFKSDWEKI